MNWRTPRSWSELSFRLYNKCSAMTIQKFAGKRISHYQRICTSINRIITSTLIFPGGIFSSIFHLFYVENPKLFKIDGNRRKFIIVLCSYYFTFRLWENWYELWVENFLRFTRETKIGLEKPILKFRVPAGHEKFQRLREANFCLPREPEKTFHEQFISVWAHPKGKIIRTDCFISFFGYLRVYDQ